MRAAEQRRVPTRPEGHRANTVTVTPSEASRVRVIFEPRSGYALGLSEIEVWARAP